THIVEDIGQTCRDLAVLSGGKLLFRGSPSELIQAAEGHVWTAGAAIGRKPDAGSTIVSMLLLAEGIQYRLVGDRLPDTEGARAAAPSLEDGYVWLMKNAGQSVDATQPTWPVRAVGGAAILERCRPAGTPILPSVQIAGSGAEPPLTHLVLINKIKTYANSELPLTHGRAGPDISRLVR
ncbi:MAG: hypothetical protein ABIG68_14020, partial [Acidobacteriota bacterium]